MVFTLFSEEFARLDFEADQAWLQYRRACEAQGCARQDNAHMPSPETHLALQTANAALSAAKARCRAAGLPSWGWPQKEEFQD